MRTQKSVNRNHGTADKSMCSKSVLRWRHSPERFYLVRFEILIIDEVVEDDDGAYNQPARE